MLSYLHSAAVGLLTVDMKRNELWPREKMVRVTGNTTLRGARGRGDERQIYKYRKGKPNGEMGNVSLKDICGHWNLWLSGSKAGPKQ